MEKNEKKTTVNWDKESIDMAFSQAIGKCITIDTEMNGMKMGVSYCRVGEDEVRVKGIIKWDDGDVSEVNSTFRRNVSGKGGD